MKGRKLLLNIPSKDFGKIENLVKTGEFTTRSDLIRFALKQFLYSKERMKEFNRITTKLQKQTKKMGLTKEDVLKEIEEIRGKS